MHVGNISILEIRMYVRNICMLEINACHKYILVRNMCMSKIYAY